MQREIDTIGKIGFKELSFADLGTGTSHQTHIGLYSGVLENLGNNEIIPSSILIFKNRCYRLDCYFDRIQNPDGSFRSPKIRSGNSESIARKIREFAAYIHEPLYLLWFGLMDGTIVFYLLTDQDEEFHFIINEVEYFGTHDISLRLKEYLKRRMSIVE